MIQAKFLAKEDLKDYKKEYNSRGITGEYDVSLSVIGLFDSHKAHWKYYAVSTLKDNMNKLVITNDLNPGISEPANTDSVKKLGKEFPSEEDATKFISEFKIKWETTSNNSLQEIRDQKLKELTK